MCNLSRIFCGIKLKMKLPMQNPVLSVVVLNKGTMSSTAIGQASINLEDHFNQILRMKIQKKLAKNPVTMLSSSGTEVGKVVMEIWMLPASEVMGTNIVGEERNDPNHSPNLPMPEEGRDISDMFGGLLGDLSFSFFPFGFMYKFVGIVVVFGGLYVVIKG